MKSSLIRLAWIITCSFLTIIGVGWGTRYDWPDFVHIDYGFPSNWATHTLITITGPTDHWTVNITMLIIDLILWQTILIIGIFVIELKIYKKL